MLRKLALLTALSCSLTAQAADVGPVAPDAGVRRGALYRVEHGGHTSYLFGTVHMGKRAYFPLAPEVTQAMAGAGTLVLEVDVHASEPFQQALARHGLYPDGDSLPAHLAPATLARLRPALAKLGLGLDDVARYRPWLVANVLVGKALEAAGFQSGMGVEGWLLNKANLQGKPLRPLETAEYQMGLFSTLDDAQQETYLLENLDDLDSGAALRKSAGLVEAWSAADAPRIAALTAELTAGGSVAARFMAGTLLGKRNPEMAAGIADILRRDGSAFIGIGLLHLVGEHGVPALLRQQGYAVEQVY